jgi:hypothetical protein
MWEQLFSGLYIYIYIGLHTYDFYPYLLPIFGYFVFGVFSGHAVYLPELFPTADGGNATILRKY